MRRSPLAVVVLLVLGALVAPLLALSSGVAGASPGAAPTAAAPARKAAVRSQLVETAAGFQGRLVSNRLGCVRGRDVYLIVGDGSGRPSATYAATTDSAGRWSLDAARRGVTGGTRFFTAFTLGDRACQIAQSKTLRSTVDRGAADRARKAPVSITFEGNGPDAADFHGRISSKRSACERFRPVFVFSRAVGSDTPYVTQLFSVSRASGVWNGLEDGEDPRVHATGGAVEALVAVPGNSRCRPAQSATKFLS